MTTALEGGEASTEIDNLLVSWTPQRANRWTLAFGRFDAPIGFERDDEPLNLVATNSFNFTYARPVKLTDRPPTRNVRASDRVTVKPISRADVAWHILTLAEDPAPGHQRTPVITTGASRKSRPAGTGNLSARQAPTVR